MRWDWLAYPTVLLLMHSATGAREPGRDIGFLTCSVTGSASSPIGGGLQPSRETREMLCAFRPSTSGAEETYAGTFQILGEDRDLSSRRVFIWIVKSTPATTVSSGLLQQSYAADPSTVSVHAAPLVGENNDALVLHAMDEVASTTDGKTAVLNGFIVLVVLKLKTSPA